MKTCNFCGLPQQHPCATSSQARDCHAQPPDALAQTTQVPSFKEGPTEHEQILAGLVKRLARRLQPGDNLRVAATEYLKEQGFFDPLRTNGVKGPDRG